LQVPPVQLERLEHKALRVVQEDRDHPGPLVQQVFQVDSHFQVQREQLESLVDLERPGLLDQLVGVHTFAFKTFSLKGGQKK